MGKEFIILTLFAVIPWLVMVGHEMTEISSIGLFSTFFLSWKTTTKNLKLFIKDFLSFYH